MRAGASGILVFLMLVPSIGLASLLCDRYERAIQALSGDSQGKVVPVMSRPSGAQDKSPPREVGCQIEGTPFNRAVMLGFMKPELGGANHALAAKNIYINAGVKTAPKPEPTLGAEAFSLLTNVTNLASPTPNSLVVIGHRESIAVQLALQKGYQSKIDIAETDLDLARALVRRVLDDVR